MRYSQSDSSELGSVHEGLLKLLKRLSRGRVLATYIYIHSYEPSKLIRDVRVSISTDTDSMFEASATLH